MATLLQWSQPFLLASRLVVAPVPGVGCCGVNWLACGVAGVLENLVYLTRACDCLAG